MKKKKTHKGMIIHLRLMNMRLIALVTLLSFSFGIGLPKFIEPNTSFTHKKSESVAVSSSNSHDKSRIEKSQGLYYSNQDLLESEEEAEFFTEKKFSNVDFYSFSFLVLKPLFLYYASKEKEYFKQINEKACQTKDFCVHNCVFRI